MSCRIANSRYFDWLCLSPSTISFRASLAWVPHANRIEALHYCNFLWPPYRAGHYILQLWFVSSFFFFSSPILSGLRLDVCHTFTHDVALVQITQKNRHLRTIARCCRAISSHLRHISTIGKTFLNSNISSACPHNMVNFGPLTAEIGWRVWGTHAANFNGFRVLASLLH